MGNEGDPNLYFSTPGPWNVNVTRPIHSPLGEIVYAGTKWGSQATHAHAAPPHFMRPTPHFLLVLTLEGKAGYRDGTGLRGTLQPGSLIWAAPGVNQSYGPNPGERWSELFLWFRGPLFDAWQAGGFPGERSRHLALSPLNYWTDRLRRILQPSSEAPAESELARLCHFQQWLADALQFEEKRKETAETLRWREQAEEKLRTGRLTDPSLEEIARSMGMSYSAFRKRFVQTSGKSPGEYRADEIVRRACSLLLESNETLAAIAADLGFHDAFHLSKRFKQVVGMSPQEFRRQNRGRSGN